MRPSVSGSAACLSQEQCLCRCACQSSKPRCWRTSNRQRSEGVHQ
uniref:Uncharacterized protein n=1 Tax=Dulem virus 32 TaxID=3145750 RepID=A0AAU8B0L7_9CAUD